MTTTTDQVREFGRAWADAEVRGDVDTLAGMATDDFTLVGPFGFVLDKGQWLDRYASGALETSELDWHDVEVRDYGDAAVAVGVHTQQAAYMGNAMNGDFRATHTLVRTPAGGWALAAVQLSPMAAPPAPPAPPD
jgi:ketosteroid isomerase-like protein